MSANPITKRDSNGRLLPGYANLNPKGRPRTGLALTEMIRELVPPELLVEQAYLLAMGHPVIRDLQYLRDCAKAERDGTTPPEPPRNIDDPIWPTQADRLAAIKFLAEWGYQKPVQQVEVMAPSTPRLDLSKLTQSELDEYERVQRKMAGLPELIEG